MVSESIIVTSLILLSSCSVQLMRILYKSKCNTINCCCNLVSFKRNISAETQIDIINKNNPISNHNDANKNNDSQDNIMENMIILRDAPETPK
jgi:hypothetical protein